MIGTATLDRAQRLTIGVGAFAAGVWLFANTAQYRDGEAWSAAQIVQAMFGGTYRPQGSSTFFVGVGTPRAIGLNITPACSTAAVAGGALVLTGALIALARVRIARAALGLFAAVALVAVVNVLRLVVLSWSAMHYGVSGWFEWLHVYGGSLVTMLAVILAVGVYLWVIRRSRPTPTPRR